MNLLQKFISRIHPEGYFFIFTFALISMILSYFITSFLYIGIIITFWCVFFFRDPQRVTPIGDEYIVSTADGVVQMITKAKLPKELGGEGEDKTRISIFLNIFNVHVNRIPISGKIKSLHYYPGKFFNASLDKASVYNERQSILMETKEGKEIAFVQIAGLIARRIICNLEENQEVKTGERFGIIRFGSRMDIYLPDGVAPLVAQGQTVIAGETILANINNKEQIFGEIR